MHAVHYVTARTLTRASLPFTSLAIFSSAFFLIGIGFGLWFDSQHAFQQSWVTLAKFGASLCAYSITMQWLALQIGQNSHSMRFAAVLASIGGTVVLFSHFIHALLASFCPDSQAQCDLLTHLARLAIVPPTLYIAASFRAVLKEPSISNALKRSLLWATGLALIGCLPAILMLLPEFFHGIPALQALSSKNSHEDLKLAHFTGLHALQMLPIYCWLVSARKIPSLQQAELIDSMGLVILALIVLLAIKGVLSQPLLGPGPLTLLIGGFVAFGLQKNLILLICQNPHQNWQTNGS